jgi:hypothetical protein
MIGRTDAFDLPLLLTKEGGEGWGEEEFFWDHPSLRLSPHSFLAGRECPTALAVTTSPLANILPIIKRNWY